ncbi:trypsin-like serine peptidase [Mammaliicoccus sciuri]|uniref:trypsin-like serine peptidase n=1 Tax=Mammaliicoccus sciuri TaxID=1296 RepID=UPI0028873AD5|nr:trypsin-like serine protease [Mammaliicoccus sciuri]MDT0754960.1 trypsin-like serine protease [Mammaliicoccus sciuri]
MKKFIYLITFLFVINISIISNQAFAEESNQSDINTLEEILNESDISNNEISKYENEGLITNLETENSSIEDVEHIDSEESNSNSDAILEESEKFNDNDTVNNENKKNNSEKQNTQSENNSIEKANIESENDEDATNKKVISEENVNDESSTFSEEKLDGNQAKGENINNLDESIIGSDDRKIVKDIKKNPYKSIVFIKSYFDDYKYIGGTGFMIDDYSVLTAAHVVDNKDIKIKKIVVYAGYQDNKATIDTVNVIKKYTIPEWINTSNSNMDMALLILEKPLGKTIGKLNIVDKSNINELVFTSGYPGVNDLNKGKIKPGNQYFSSGKIVKITNNKLFYDLDSERGQSGSPVFNNNNEVIGIHINGFKPEDKYTFNSAVKLSSSKIELIKEWNEELKLERYDKVIYVNKSVAKIWKDLNLKELVFNNQDVKGRIYRAQTVYTDSTGGKYILIKDKDHQFVGFININDTTEIKPVYTDKVVQLKRENIKLYKNLFGDLQTDKKLSFSRYYKIKEIYNLPNNLTLYTLCDGNGKWIGNVNKNDVRETIFEPYDERVEIIKNNYTVWGNFFGKENLNTKSMYYKVYNAKGIYKDNNNNTYIKIYDSNDKYLGILNINATKKVVPQGFNKKVKIISAKYNFYNFLFDTIRNKSQNYINKKLHSKCLYKLSNGKIYYSLYDNKDKWIGYIEKNAVKVL